MKALVVYDSKFGNTERVARAIAEKLGVGEPAPVMPVGAVSKHNLIGIDLLVVGGPTQGHGVSSALRVFLAGIPQDVVRGMSTASFDTRLRWPRILSGSAAAGCARRLEQKGARLLVSPECFLVTSAEGPLVEGELARASAWADDLRIKASLLDQKPTPVAP